MVLKKKVGFQKLCNSLALGLYSDNDNFEICTYYDNMQEKKIKEKEQMTN